MSVIHRRDCVLFTFMTTDLYCIVHTRSLSLLHPFTPHPFPCILRFIRHFISGVAYTRRAPVTVPPPTTARTLCFLASFVLPFRFRHAVLRSRAAIDLSADGLLHSPPSPIMTSPTYKHGRAPLAASPGAYWRKG